MTSNSWPCDICLVIIRCTNKYIHQRQLQTFRKCGMPQQPYDTAITVCNNRNSVIFYLDKTKSNYVYLRVVWIIMHENYFKCHGMNFLLAFRNQYIYIYIYIYIYSDESNQHKCKLATWSFLLVVAFFRLEYIKNNQSDIDTMCYYTSS